MAVLNIIAPYLANTLRYACRMSTPLLYLIINVLVIFASLFVCIYCIIKVVQVSNGFSLLDPEASNGLRIRKWFLLGVALATGFRCSLSLCEFVTFSIKVVKGDADIYSISYYGGLSRTLDAPYLIFVCRTLPTLLYLGYLGLVALYVAYLHHTWFGLDFSIARIVWISCNAVLCVTVLQYIFVYPMPSAINIIYLCMESALLLTVLRYSVSIWNFLSDNNPITGSTTRKVGKRFFYFTVLNLSSLLIGILVHIFDLSRIGVDW